MHFDVNDLIQYTAWERRQWQEFLHGKGDQVLQISAGPNGDGRFDTIGNLIQHIFMAEKRYVERLLGQPLTEMNSIPSDRIEVLFDFGRQSRNEFKHLLETFAAAEWDVQREFLILTYRIKATPNKIASHVLMHEIRHWAQIGTLLRLNGVVTQFHDFLASPVMGGEWTTAT
jgi:uncharacterized damage-inducible protein DinB